ncbi:MAG: hypothetical protein HC903_27800 [Methylacidiphilales bacterium]|nr:hypothetical protein [Candidatus Methylacidiphilales bacterium]
MTISSDIINKFNSKTVNFIEELESISWLQNVGSYLHTQEVTQLFSWNEAWENLQDKNWINASFHEHVDNMNPVWDIAYDKALEVVSKSINCHEFEDGISVADAIAYDAAAAAVEISIGSASTFFTDLMKWYRLGHFPCGWDGQYPLGKLIVY